MSTKDLDLLQQAVVPLGQVDHTCDPDLDKRDLRYVYTESHEMLARQMAADYVRGRRVFVLVGEPGTGRETFLRTLAWATGRTYVRYSGLALSEMLYADTCGASTETEILPATFLQDLCLEKQLVVLSPPPELGQRDILQQLTYQVNGGKLSFPLVAGGNTVNLASDRLLIFVVEQIQDTALDSSLLVHFPPWQHEVTRILERHLWFDLQGDEQVSDPQELEHDACFRDAVGEANTAHSGSWRPSVSDLLEFARLRRTVGLRTATAVLARRSGGLFDEYDLLCIFTGKPLLSEATAPLVAPSKRRLVREKLVRYARGLLEPSTR